MDVNKMIIETRARLLEVVNTSGLPITVLDLLLTELKTAVGNKVIELVNSMQPEEEEVESDGTE